MSHFVLGICPEITAEQLVIVSAIVTQNGTPIALTATTSLESDPTTGCTGLKVEFSGDEFGDSLPKTAGTVLTLTFDLTTPYPIGPIPVCVKGGPGQNSFNNLTICGPICDASICDETVYRQVKVCAPVIVTPSVSSGAAVITCCGSPVVSNTACTSTSRTCTFYVSQCLCVAIPLAFTATAVVNVNSAVCEDPTGCTCTNCPPTPTPTP